MIFQKEKKMKCSKYLRLLEEAIEKLQNQEYLTAAYLVEVANVRGDNRKKMLTEISMKNAQAAINVIKAEIREWEEMKYYDD